VAVENEPASPRGPTFDPDVGRWVGPFVMAAINEIDAA
jgi:hypothetical protein